MLLSRLIKYYRDIFILRILNILKLLSYTSLTGDRLFLSKFLRLEPIPNGITLFILELFKYTVA